ncbi:MAG: serine protein kinase RIO [Candidatus Thermoplasmatota archaeon]|jgi:RIO kinase 1|nr:serine protein kinase RIO [Candidatus Thermoplasmatota archaeon]
MTEERSALKQLIDSGEFLNSFNMDRKTSGLVFDKRTLMSIYELSSREGIDYIDFPISSGKESVIFKAYMKKKPVVLKVYKMSTLKFSNIGIYIEGDYRFARERINRSNLVFIWAKKEYTNLDATMGAGIPCPRPIAYHKNLLLMSYIGTASSPAPALRDAVFDPQLVYGQVRSYMRKLYRDASLIHADLSEYNILYYRKKPYFIDFGQSVSTKHPSADFFLERDVKNITHYFIKLGVDCTPEDLMAYIRSES